MKMKLKERDTSTPSQLVEALRNIWVHDIDRDYSKRLSDSIPKRIKAILKAHGGHTKALKYRSKVFSSFFAFFRILFVGTVFLIGIPDVKLIV